MLTFREVAYVFRVLFKRPLVPILAILSIALGVSINSAFFGLIDVLILRPLPIPYPEQLVQVSVIAPADKSNDNRASWGAFRALHDQSVTFNGVFAWNDDALRNMESEGTKYLGAVNEVSGEFFRTLEATPFLGRWINDRDMGSGSVQSAQVAVISYRCWKTHYQSDANVIGKVIIVDDHPLSIIGVTKRDFSEIDIDVLSDAIVPIGFSHAGVVTGWFNITGRLKPGASILQAQAELNTLWPNILSSTAPAAMSPEARSKYMSSRLRLSSEATGDSSLRTLYSRPLILLMGLAGSVLLLTCVNLASIMFARILSRTSEMKVRLSLGATRWRILRLVLLEATTISLMGSSLGTVISVPIQQWLIKLLWRGYVNPGLRVKVDLPILCFMVGAAFFTAIVFGSIPALKATRVQSFPASNYNKGVATGRFRVSKALILIQIVFSFLLVTAALMLTSALHKLRTSELGYDRDGVLVLTLFQQSPQRIRLNSVNYYHQLSEALRKLPGAELVSYSQSAPAFAFESTELIATPSLTIPVLHESVGPQFFELLKIPLLRGREFTWQDDEKAPGVAILSTELAYRLFHNEDPVGRRVDFGDQANGKGLTVVGVVGDADLWKPQVARSKLMAVYLPLMQVCSGCSPLALVRTKVSPLALGSSSENTILAMGHQYSVRTESLDMRFSKMFVVERLSSWLAAAFAIVALSLSSLGLYGLLSYIVQLRLGEIGTRIALGATRQNIVVHLLKESLSIVMFGIAVSAPSAYALSRLLVSLTTGLDASLSTAILRSSVVLFLTALLATSAPALRASRVSPAEALRSE